jgi:hypothetical protein
MWGADRLDAEFAYHYKDLHRTGRKIIEFVLGKKSYGMSWTPALTLQMPSWFSSFFRMLQ